MRIRRMHAQIKNTLRMAGMKSLMVEWFEQGSRWHEMYCHDLEVMSLNTGRVELGVRSTSVYVILNPPHRLPKQWQRMDNGKWKWSIQQEVCRIWHARWAYGKWIDGYREYSVKGAIEDIENTEWKEPLWQVLLIPSQNIILYRATKEGDLDVRLSQTLPHALSVIRNLTLLLH